MTARGDTISVPRREPPEWIPVSVIERGAQTRRMVRLTLGGDGLRSMESPGVASSIRLLVPPGDSELVIPQWNGNEFLLPSGERPIIRTFTPVGFDPDAASLRLEVVRHPGGAVSEWAEQAGVGAAAAISGPGRDYAPDLTARRYLILGDETALPAIGQLLEVLSHPGTAACAVLRCEVHIEVDSPEARSSSLPAGTGVEVTWHVRDAGRPPGHTLVDEALAIDELDEGTRVWAAGEAAAMQALRKHFAGELGLARTHANIRGYWKVARGAQEDPRPRARHPGVPSEV